MAKIVLYSILFSLFFITITLPKTDQKAVEKYKKILLQTQQQIEQTINAIQLLKKECDTTYNAWYNIFFRPGCYSVKLSPLQAKLELLQLLEKKQKKQLEILRTGPER